MTEVYVFYCCIMFYVRLLQSVFELHVLPECPFTVYYHGKPLFKAQLRHGYGFYLLTEGPGHCIKPHLVLLFYALLIHLFLLAVLILFSFVFVCSFVLHCPGLCSVNEDSTSCLGYFCAVLPASPSLSPPSTHSLRCRL